MFGDVFHFDWLHALDSTVDRIFDRGCVNGPPIDVLDLAASLGFVVAVDRQQQGRARCARLHGYADDQTPAIMLRPEPRVERRQWAVAHEIGEHHVHEVFAELGISCDELPTGARERAANELANHLLLPTDWFLQDGRDCDWDLPLLKRRYTTASYELIARRMLDADTPTIVTIFDHGRMSFRRSNLDGRVPGLFNAERETWTKAHITGRIQRKQDQTYLVRTWPIHEPEWKREIVRTNPRLDFE